MFSFVALCREGFFAVQGMIFAVVGPGDAARSNAERSQPRAPALSKAGTDARTGREQSLQRVHILATSVHILASAHNTTTTCTDAPPPCSLPQRAHNVAHEGSLAPTPGGLRTPPASLTTRHGNPVPCIVIIPFPVNNTLPSL